MTVFVVGGPSGVGKSTVVRAWRKASPDLRYIRTTATRAPRPGEERLDDRYEFVSLAVFERSLAAGEFAQWAHPSKGRWYGTKRRFIEEVLASDDDGVIDYSPEMFHNFRRQYPGQVTGIFLKPPSFECLVRQLKSRGTEQGKSLARKIEMARLDMEFVPGHDYCIVNDDVDRVVQALMSIRAVERLRLRPPTAAAEPARVMWRYY